MIVDLDQPRAAFALDVAGGSISLAQVCEDEHAAVRLAIAYRHQHGHMPAVVPVTVTVQRLQPPGHDL